MATVSRDEIKKRGFKRFIKSFGYSIDGLKYAYKYEQSMTIHFLMVAVVLVAGFLLKISLFEWLI